MKNVVNLLQLKFLPQSRCLGLFVLRLWLGFSMLLLHGWSKFTNFSAMAERFADPFGIGPKPSLALAVFAEVLCSILLILGLFTRAAALALAIQMSVAFFIVHQAILERGPNSGELAFMYLAGYVTLLVAGPGRFSLDEKIRF